MVFFNCLLIFPQILEHILSMTALPSSLPLLTAVFSSLIEIGGGLQHFTASFSLTNSDKIYTFLSLALLTFGGLSCIAQTCFILKNTGLKIITYIKHKFVQACIFIILIFV